MNNDERTYDSAGEVPGALGPAAGSPALAGTGPLPFGITVRFPPETPGDLRLHVTVVLATYGASDVCEYQSTEILPACVTATIPAALLHRVLNDLPHRVFVHYGMQEFHR